MSSPKFVLKNIAAKAHRFMRNKQLYNDTGLPCLSLARIKNKFKNFCKSCNKKSKERLVLKLTIKPPDSDQNHTPTPSYLFRSLRGPIRQIKDDISYVYFSVYYYSYIYCYCKICNILSVKIITIKQNEIFKKI